MSRVNHRLADEVKDLLAPRREQTVPIDAAGTLCCRGHSPATTSSLHRQKQNVTVVTAVRPKVAGSVRNVTETQSRTMFATGLGVARV